MQSGEKSTILVVVNDHFVFVVALVGALVTGTTSISSAGQGIPNDEVADGEKSDSLPVHATSKSKACQHSN